LQAESRKTAGLAREPTGFPNKSNIIDNETIKVFHAMGLREKIVAQMDTEE
jgi:hypothetical protein